MPTKINGMPKFDKIEDAVLNTRYKLSKCSWVKIQVSKKRPIAVHIITNENSGKASVQGHTDLSGGGQDIVETEVEIISDDNPISNDHSPKTGSRGTYYIIVHCDTEEMVIEFIESIKSSNSSKY